MTGLHLFQHIKGLNDEETWAICLEKSYL